MNLVNYEPFYGLRQFNELWRQLGWPSEAAVPGRAEECDFHPALNLREDEKTFVVEVELPGVAPDQIEVTTRRGVLSLKGSWPQETDREQRAIRYGVRLGASFQRDFRLPEGVDEQKIQACHKHGVLKITLPKGEQHQARRIAVEAS